MKKIALIVLLAGLTMSALAQNQVEALRYSQLLYGGTARSMAMGNTFGSLGGDFSALSTNPAGIAFYRSSEITLSPGLFIGKVSTTYLGNNSDDIKYNVNVSNVGVVFAIIPKRPEAAWKGIQIGLGMNRLANYNRNIMISGNNPENSIVDDYLEAATGTAPADLDPFSTWLAFDTYLIDTLGDLTQYISAVPRAGTRQTDYIEQRGSSSEIVLSLGGNYSDRLYIGGTFGFPSVTFTENTTYREVDEADTIAGFKEMTLNKNVETSGTGFNFKLGLIYRVTDWMRISAAFHTPTFYEFKDSYYNGVYSTFDNGQKWTSESPQGSFKYKLNTPVRLSGGLGFVIGEHALISAEYEWLDYSEARLRAKSYKFFNENEVIEQIYRGTSTIRAGAEVKFAPVCIRGGFQMSTSPFRNDFNDGSRMAFSGGVGLRDKKYFIDLAYIYQTSDEDLYLYNAQQEASATTYVNHNIVLTLGFRF